LETSASPGAHDAHQALSQSAALNAGVRIGISLALLELLRRLPTSLRDRNKALARVPGAPAAALDAALPGALRRSRAFIVAAGALDLLGAFAQLPTALRSLGPICLLLTAFAMDLLAEWRAHGRLGALSVVLEDQRVWFADALAHALERAGIPTFVRAASARTILWWKCPPRASDRDGARRAQGRSRRAHRRVDRASYPVTRH
jgi:hypothetical protein